MIDCLLFSRSLSVSTDSGACGRTLSFSPREVTHSDRLFCTLSSVSVIRQRESERVSVEEVFCRVNHSVDKSVGH